ncbi:MAG: hypothetical protein J0I99_06400 [Devosia sp.]|uniref:YHS domain-containing (seleno)protein n=1 Tax=Devosia sp. TaxID=1871048 RepID=UPI001AC708BE|nr:YHS domain-containing (seleno)protein [Devosia sp.]MBN9315346.1 hypothetical protein [Devosia sp.]
MAAAMPVRAASLVEAIVADPLTGVALEGYDPVSYFLGAEPVPGSPDHVFEWGGVPWYFVSDANRDVFSRNPEIYAPQYGGHCLTSLSRGYMSDGKPRLHVIRQAKLYLFYSVANREAFLASGDDIVALADANWAKFRDGLAGAGQDVTQALDAPAEPVADAESAGH